MTTPTPTISIELSPIQRAAVEEIKKWFNEQEELVDLSEGSFGEHPLTKPIFRVFGYAGTGKTTLIRYFMEALSIRNDTYFAAFTGKAAMVMRKQGLPASTIHSLIYQPVPPNEKECKELEKALREEADSEKRGVLKSELAEKSKVHFTLRDKEESKLKDARLLVLDECSMVNDIMLEDLLSFGVPMIVLGDPGQLPPIDGEGALTKVQPDVLLTEIHRQAKDNPIIDFATRARMGLKYFPKLQLGDSKHCDQVSLSKDEVLSFDQIICGKNATRNKLNQRVRELRGFDGVYPSVGEKLICLKNRAEEGLFNGLMCEVVGVGDLLDTTITLTIKRETDLPNQPPLVVKALRAHFDAYQDPDAYKSLRWWDKTGSDEFDFGYTVTCHKSQGSQWDKVLIWDDKFLVWKPQERAKWLYTAITRAVESVTIAS
jgi:exodeoxyribonuclease-5